MNKLRSLIFPFLLGCTHVWAHHDVTVYEYHNQPPFVVNSAGEAGLSFDAVRLLNQISAGKHHYRLEVIPRPRLNESVLPVWIQNKCPSAAPCTYPRNWVVLWAMPNWGWGAQAQTRYHWQPLFEDHDAVIVRRDTSWTYIKPQSLSGKTLGGLRGHTYPIFSEMASKGMLKIEDAGSEDALLDRVHKKQVDAVIVQYSALRYYMQRRSGFQTDLTSFCYQTIHAAALMPPQDVDSQADFLQLSQSASWKALLKKNKITTDEKGNSLGCPSNSGVSN